MDGTVIIAAAAAVLGGIYLLSLMEDDPEAEDAFDDSTGPIPEGLGSDYTVTRSWCDAAANNNIMPWEPQATWDAEYASCMQTYGF
jgi:hypothetical protein